VDHDIERESEAAGTYLRFGPKNTDGRDINFI
jgi:hypothetical protein